MDKSVRMAAPSAVPLPVYEATELYHDDDGNIVNFSAGGVDPDTRDRERLLRDAERFMHDLLPEDVEDEDETVSSVARILQAMGFQDSDDEDEEPNLQHAMHEAIDEKWAPYPNKTMYLLDILDNLPRLRMSDTQLNAVLFVMRQCGARDVPALATLRRMQDRLRDEIATPTSRHVSSDGNVFHTNPIPGQVAEDLANPLVAPEIVRYPEVCSDGKVSESWQAKKWIEDVGLDELTPMVIHRNQHFYVNELAQLEDGGYVLPIRWIKRDGVMCGDVFRVSRQQDGRFAIRDYTKTHPQPISNFRYCFIDLEAMLSPTGGIKFAGEQSCLEENMPHKIRVQATGKPFYTIWINLWGDDVSGNRSKQWNKHLNWYFQHAGLPKHLLHQEYFVRFVSTSPHASSLEQAKAILDDIRAFDCSLHEEILFRIGILHLPADNPMQSELSSHIGLKGNHFCRKCTVGGPHAYKQSDEGFSQIFTPQTPRTPKATMDGLALQIQHAIHGREKELEIHQRETGIKDVQTTKCIQRAATERKGFSADNPGISENEKDKHMEAWLRDQLELLNPFLAMGFNPQRDTPVEALHTVLLGTIKYLWTITCTKIVSDKSLDAFQTRLASVNVRGLNIPPIRAAYLIQYRGALIGRQFKQLVQIMAYATHGLVPDIYTQAWHTAGAMTARLWHPEIDDMESYINSLELEIANFLDTMAAIDPERIIAKPKFHLTAHFVEDIPRFGPSLLFSTEMFEAYNAIFRFCSILSNHHAPSRDITLNFSGLYRLKHITSGGWWKDKQRGWIRAGADIRQFFLKTHKLQEWLGWLSPRRIEAGTVRYAPIRERDTIWSSTHASKAIPVHVASVPNITPHTEVIRCAHVVCSLHDIAKPDDFVVISNPDDSENIKTVIGRVQEIVHVPSIHNQSHESTQPTALVVIEHFSVGNIHGTWKMPTLHARIEPQLMLVDSKFLRFVVNVQHDCIRGECKSDTSQFEEQERELTTRKVARIKHTDSKHFVVNLHGLHNPHILPNFFPDDMVQVHPIYPDRLAHYRGLAEQLRTRVGEKRDVTQAKRAATKAVKQAGQNRASASTGPPTKRRKRQREPEETDAVNANAELGAVADDWGAGGMLAHAIL
ncbi:hypothetical protein OF83DRAFT_1171639 [Amylostereum chailletii]|nr:hypothetical protein OF83DRAFT_1171639 [Amylostereum chailletii]